MINFACPDCGMSYEVKDEFAGRETKCRCCRRLLLVPAVALGSPTVDSCIAPAQAAVSTPPPSAIPVGVLPGKVPLEFVQRLMQTAVDIHDREVRRHERWTLFFPLIIAIIGAVGSVVTAAVGLAVSKG